MDGAQMVEVSIKQTEIFSLISSSISIVLGVVAIVLSILFYKMSERSASEASKYAKDIDTNVKKLEVLFDKLYDGTFSIMRDTVTDMRKYVYSDFSKINSEEDEFTQKVKKKTLQEVNMIVSEIKGNSKSDDELKQLILNVIEESKKVENDLKINTLREKLIDFLKRNGEISFTKLSFFMAEEANVPINQVFKELDNLSREGIIVDEFERRDGKIAGSISGNAKMRLK